MARKMKPWARLVLCGNGQYQKLMPPKTLEELAVTLMKRSRVEDRGYKTPCRIWVGCKDTCGYGVLRYLGKNRKTQRLSWMVSHGKEPESKIEVCHKCDQPDCFEATHLFAGTHLENMLDARNKGRIVTTCGERHYCCSFTEEQIVELRLKFKNGLKVTRKLANELKVSPAALNKIKNFKSWKHIK